MSDAKDRELERKIRDLPRSMEPERDLWIDIAARIEAKRPPAALLGGLAKRKRVAIAAGVVALSAAAAVAVVSRRRVEGPSAKIETPPPVLPSAAPPAPPNRAEHEVYVVALRALEASFAEQRRLLPDDAVQRIQTSLAVLDDAIGATKKALEATPDSAELEGQLRDEYEQKIRALTDVVDLVRGAS
jgi:hypothetical protein